MKTGNALLFAAAGAAAIYFLKNSTTNTKPTPSNEFKEFISPIQQGNVTPMGNIISEQITSAKEGVSYINKYYGGAASKPTVQQAIEAAVPNLPENRTVASNFRTSLNKNLLLEKRSGGGYKVVGAKNIVLTPPTRH